MRTALYSAISNINAICFIFFRKAVIGRLLLLVTITLGVRASRWLMIWLSRNTSLLFSFAFYRIRNYGNENLFQSNGRSLAFDFILNSFLIWAMQYTHIWIFRISHSASYKPTNVSSHQHTKLFKREKLLKMKTFHEGEKEKLHQI